MGVRSRGWARAVGGRGWAHVAVDGRGPWVGVGGRLSVGGCGIVGCYAWMCMGVGGRVLVSVGGGGRGWLERVGIGMGCVGGLV